MTTKLTLTIEKSIIERAKVYAKGTQRSLSEMVEKYLERVTDQRLPDEDISPRLKKIAGSLPLPEEFDDKQALDDYYSKKYKL
ncbi:DUF6364 family protein [Niabella ginsengisoli]|uniref:DUF6364 family protein n=1 Tax=Niabella ginsengisoli TaxID=522298 RepID=A0ABS9SPY0_9BACT|nr:DUF6364 family protein [Niabella ginsengisoli]MCH5600417.1 DUF6364 family protein [Niabella ginsengisoli]